MTFEALGLSAPILAALKEQGYEKPSPIQEKAIPPALTGRDILGCAQTGTGKTCAFAAPILQRLSAVREKGRPIRALILTPTRELAIQIGENLESYGRHLPLRSTVIFGGVSQNPQVEALKRGVDVLVATPGRLGDLYQQKLVDLTHIQIFVLDEADRMLDMGFIHDVKKILKWLPAEKQTMLFSATMPPEIAKLVDSLLKDPARVAVDPVSSPVEAIRQSVYFVDKGNKTRLLAQLVEERGAKNALVFTRTKHGANKVARDLEKLGISAAAIHGNKSQSARQQALADFKAGRLRCLVATDIAARGLDIEELSHVFNYNLPEVPETYVHRIGRTGRAGRGGEAIALCDFGEQPLLRDIEKLIGRKLPVVEGHPYPMVVLEAPKRDKNGKIINPEDAEARAAARARKEERLAAQRAREQEAAKAAAAKPAPEAEPAEEKRPARRRRRRGKGGGEAAAQPQQAQPVLQPERAERPKLTRPGTRLDTGDAMPCTEFTRPDPLGGDSILDATARLLAPRKSVIKSPAAPERREERGGRRKRRGSGESHSAQSAAPAAEEKRAAKGRSGKGEKQPVKAQPVKNERQHAGNGREEPQRGRSRRERRPFQLDAPRGKHTKDSTEQKSLMKPYYLDIK